MTLRIESLSLRNFRNYEDAALNELGDITVLVGENAVGKTNLIEAIQLLTALTSFRHGTADQLIRHGEEHSRVSMQATDGNRRLDIDLTLDGRTRKYRLNGKAKRPIDLKGLIPSVVFTPDDLDLVKGPNSGRRSSLDTLGAQVNKSYYTVRRDYEKVIQATRIAFSKRRPMTLLVEAINEMIVTVGAQLTIYRIALFERLLPHLTAKYQEISQGRDCLNAVYVPSWGKGAPEETVEPLTRDEAREALARALHERAEEERGRGRAVVGPHSDEIVFTLDGENASIYGSQGQQRSIVLSYKLAEAAVIEEIIDQKRCSFLTM